MAFDNLFAPRMPRAGSPGCCSSPPCHRGHLFQLRPQLGQPCTVIAHHLLRVGPARVRQAALDDRPVTQADRTRCRLQRPHVMVILQRDADAARPG